MSDEFDYLAHPYGVKIIGPFVEEYKLTIKDFEVPHLKATSAGEGYWNLFISGGPSMIQCSDDELRKWIGFIADAMAVAAGYSSHGEHSGRVNPYKRRLLGISSIETDPGETTPR